MATTQEEILARHRKEQRDLQSRITQKKRGASKKTRKGVSAECEALELALKETQAAELLAINGHAPSPSSSGVSPSSTLDSDTNTAAAAVAGSLIDLNLSYSADVTKLNDNVIPTGNSTTEDHDDDDNKNNKTTQNSTLSSSTPLMSASASASAIPPHKPNRQKARLARRAAAQSALSAQASLEAATQPNLREQERSTMAAALAARGLCEKEIRADGHCLYSAVADQLDSIGVRLRLPPRSSHTYGTSIQPIPAAARTEEDEGGEVVEDGLEAYKAVRRAAAEEILSKPDDFAPFIEEDADADSIKSARRDEKERVDEYARRVRDTAEWGGQLELLALARAYGVRVHVLQGDGRVEVVGDGGHDDDGSESRKAVDDGGGGGGRAGDVVGDRVGGKRVDGKSTDTHRAREVWVAYYRHYFGLGEHYNSLRRV
ncbi:MAG: hypothetical protein M1825_005008 [Sarcosagium campestre]|nr:MAG: hypothetical protein M1825_005008 [Sarcosagium campestre]